MDKHFQVCKILHSVAGSYTFTSVEDFCKGLTGARLL